MELLHLIILGLLQGLTEFLPISSSAHLILLPKIFDWIDQGLSYDIAVHVGSLSAVVHYFRADIKQILSGWSASPRDNENSRMLWFIAVGTIPVGLVGLLGHDFIATHLRSPLVIAVATIVFALVLWWSDVKGKQIRSQDQLTWKDVVIIGLAQCLALIPGTSRSGITITAGLLLGLNREAAARFSFLLAIPVISLAGLYESYKLLSSPVQYDWLSLFLVTLISAISAWLAIHYFLKFLERTGMLPYVIYRLLLGMVLLMLFV